MEKLKDFLRGFRSKTTETVPPIAEIQKMRKPTIIVPTESSKIKYTYERSSYLNEEEEKEEITNLQREISDAKTSFGHIASSVTTVTTQRGDIEGLRTWSSSINKIGGARDFGASLDKQLGEQSKANNLTIEEFKDHRVLRTGAGLIIKHSLQDLRALMKECHLDDAFNPYATLLEYLNVGWISIRINGISIQDLMDHNRRSSLSASSLYEFFLKSRMVKQKIQHDEVLKENLEYPKDKFPNISKGMIEIATSVIIEAIGFPTERLDDFIKNNTGIARESARWARRFVQKINQMHQKIFYTLVNPDSPDFPQMKEKIEHYLKQKWTDRTSALIMLVGVNKSLISTLYRKSIEFANINNNADFYKLLANSLIEYVQALSLREGMMTKDDIVSLIDQEKSNNTPAPTLENLRKLTGTISQKPYRSEHSLDPQSINWHNLVPPTSIRVELLRGPSKFNLLLHYENEDGEALDFNLAFDTKKGEFEWPLIEAPDDPEMKDMRDAVLFAAQSILIDIERKAKLEYQEEQKKKVKQIKTPIVSPPEPSQTKPIAQTPWVPRTKEGKPAKPKPFTPLQKVLESQFTTPFQEEVRGHIDRPNEKNMRIMMERISLSNQDRILAGITRFNNDGVGRFKALNYMKHEGKPVWELRVAGFRVLVTKVDSTNGSSNGKKHAFEIIKIGDRKAIFKKKK